MNRTFHLRLHANYHTDKNLIATLQLEILKENEWQAFQIDNLTGGFLLLINGLFSCQHLYMRTNSAERQIVLSSTKGHLDIETDQNWHIIKADVHFDALLKSNSPSQADMDYILERMTHCPVSSNLKNQIKVKNTVSFLCI